jgi:hypothetical protein
LEVAPDGSVVWEYVHPLQEVEHGRKLVAALGRGVTRYDPSYISFLAEPIHDQIVSHGKNSSNSAAWSEE